LSFFFLFILLLQSKKSLQKKTFEKKNMKISSKKQ